MSASNTMAPTDSQENRRRHTRHQLVERVMMRMKDGKTYAGTSFELSKGGMSAVFVGAALAVSDVVELYPVAGLRLAAEVRRMHKNIIGFQFKGLRPEQESILGEKCEGLPLFRTMLDI